MNVRCWLVLLTVSMQAWVYSQDKPVVAVLDFKNTTGKFFLDEMARGFSSQLKTELSQEHSLVIVERQKIEDILKEQDFVLSDLSSDKDKQTKVGDLLGADYVITGDLSESGELIRVDVAITRISTGQVIGEKVSGPSKSSSHVMARLLANNIVFQLTGNGRRIESIKLKGSPTTAWLTATGVLTLGSLVAWNNAQKYRTDYQHTTDFSKMQDTYKRANRWHKAAPGLTVAAGVAAVTWVYLFIKNRSSNLEVLADDGNRSADHLVIQPMLDSDGQRGIQLSIPF